MGAYTEIQILATFDNEETAKQFSESVKNLNGYITKKMELKGEVEEFYTNVVTNVQGGVEVEIMLSSERTSNADYQANHIFDLAIELYKPNMLEFSAEQLIPDTIIWWSANDEEGEDE